LYVPNAQNTAQITQSPNLVALVGNDGEEKNGKRFVCAATVNQSRDKKGAATFLFESLF
jgi:hypothetical protein